MLVLFERGAVLDDETWGLEGGLMLSLTELLFVITKFGDVFGWSGGSMFGERCF